MHLRNRLRERNPHIAHFTTGSYSLRNAVLEVLQHKPHILCETLDKKAPTSAEVEALHLINSGCDAGISLYAKTCYRSTVAEDITAAFADYYKLNGSQINNIHLCLHEAIINGVIHGNLSVPGVFKSKEMLSGYYEWIEARLATPVLSHSRIQVRATLKEHTLLLEVIDQGRGYLFQNYLEQSALEMHQGLNLIRMCSQRMRVLGIGNHLQMEFDL